MNNSNHRCSQLETPVGGTMMSDMTRRSFVQAAIMASGTILAGGFPLHALSNVTTETIYRAPRLDLAQQCAVWACWIGQSTVLLKMGSSWVLTDPVFSDVVGLNLLGLRIGPRRITPPALQIDEIPRPDIVVLSHAHMDHLDLPTLDALTARWPGQITVLTPPNTSDLLVEFPWKHIGEIDWNETSMTEGVVIKALRVTHNGWRLPGEPCRAAGNLRRGRSYNGYLLEVDGIRVVFGGDTAYTTSFREISGEIDLAIMPIGAYEGFENLHCTPEQALEMSTMMRARSMMPIHHLTFKQSAEPIIEPIQRLQKKARELDVVLAARLPGSTYSMLG